MRAFFSHNFICFPGINIQAAVYRIKAITELRDCVCPLQRANILKSIDPIFVVHQQNF